MSARQTTPDLLPSEGPSPGHRRPATGGFAALSNPQFRALWFGLLFSQGAMQINMVARPWLAYHVSGSSASLGIVAVASGAPMALVSLFAGALVDRSDKRRLLLIVTALLALLAAATGILVHADIVTVWQLALVGFVQGAVFAFNFPTRSALIPALVPDDQLASAIAMNSTGLNLNRMAVPAAAGLLLAWQPALAFDVVTVLYAASFLMLLRLPVVRAASVGGSALRDVVAGFSYVWREHAVLSLLLLALFPTLLGMPFQQFLPVFQQDVLHLGPASLGLMFTAVGVGSLAGSIGVAYVPPHRGRQFQLMGGFAFGLALVAFALSTTLPVTLVALALVGFTSQGYFVLNNVLLMAATDQKYYGRTMSIYMLTWSMMPVAVLPMGILIDQIGMPVTQAGAGLLLTGLIGAFWLVRRPRLRRASAPASLSAER